MEETRKKSASLLIAQLMIAVYAPLNAQETLSLEVLDTYTLDAFDEGVAEIAAHDPGTQVLFVINGDSRTID